MINTKDAVNCKIYKLINVAKIIKGTEPGRNSYCQAPKGIKFIRVGDITGKSKKPVNTTSDNVVICNTNNILMSFDGNPGIVSRGLSGAISSGIRIIKPDSKKIDVDYLYYYLKTNAIQDVIKKYTTGATIKHASKSIEHLGIILPPLHIQRKKAHKLNKIMSLMNYRKEAILQLETIIHSIFQEKIGNPTLNPRNWKTYSLEQITNEIYRYPTFYGLKYVTNGIPVVRIGNITNNGYLDNNLKNYVFIDPDVSEKFPRTQLAYQDVVLAVRGDGSTGKVGLVSTKNLINANISPNLIRIQVNSKIIHPLFFFYLFSSLYGQQLLQHNITRTSKKKITAYVLKKMKLPIPPINHQYNFVNIMEEITVINNLQYKSYDELTILYESIFHKEFNHFYFSDNT